MKTLGMRITFSFFIMILTSAPLTAWADIKPAAKSQNEHPAIADTLPSTSKPASAQENTAQPKFDNEDEASLILRTLKNPFIPQLPRKEIPEPANKNVDVQPTPEVSLIPSVDASPTVTPAPTKPDFKIAGMVWNTQRPQAIINGIILDEGESIESWKITSITQKGIKVENSGSEYVLKP